jgi:hypothetical protein
MTRATSGLRPKPWTPVRKVFWWIIMPLVLILNAVSIFAARRPPADLDQRTLFASSCGKALDSALPSGMMAFFIDLEDLKSTPEGYVWRGETMGDNEAGNPVDFRITCEGSPLNPKIQLQECKFSSDDASVGR